MNYFKLLEYIKEKNLNKNLLVIDKVSYSYSEVYKLTQSLSEEIKYNIEDNRQVIFIYSDNFLFQLISFFSINECNSVPVILHPSLPSISLEELIVTNNIKYVITDKEINLQNKNQCIKLKNSFLYKIIDIKSHKLDNKICIGALTSGSTNIPKVLFRSYKSWADFFVIQNEVFIINNNSKLFINGPLSFTGNLNSLLSVLYEGGEIIYVSNFNCRLWIKDIEEYKVTNIYLVPAKLKMLNKVLKKTIHNVNSIFTGSQLLPMEIAKELKEKFYGSKLILYYGASELNYISYFNFEEKETRLFNLGKPFPRVEVFIKDGYIYTDSEFHVEGLKSPCTVYDLGHFDDDGFLIFEGRKDDIINRAGVKISTIKIEEEIMRIKEVDKVSVITYDDQKKGSEIAAFVVLNDHITRDNIIRCLSKRLMNIELPKKVIFIDNLPLNSSGKIDRQLLKLYIAKEKNRPI